MNIPQLKDPNISKEEKVELITQLLQSNPNITDRERHDMLLLCEEYSKKVKVEEDKSGVEEDKSGLEQQLVGLQINVNGKRSPPSDIVPPSYPLIKTEKKRKTESSSSSSNGQIESIPIIPLGEQRTWACTNCKKCQEFEGHRSEPCLGCGCDLLFHLKGEEDYDEFWQPIDKDEDSEIEIN